MNALAYKNLRKILLWTMLLIYGFIILYPIFLMIITSLKTTREIFTNPFGIPDTLNLQNYRDLFDTTRYDRYFLNSLFTTGLSLSIILVLSAHAAYILSRYTFKLRYLIYMLFITGLILPIRLGTISLLQSMIRFGVYDSLISLVLVNSALGIPFGIFILTDFIKMIPEELDNAARIDGCSESAIFYRIITPLLRPALAATALVNLIPVWNDFWFPLIFIRTDIKKTVPLATALLFGQFQTNFGLVFAVLTCTSIPAILIYLLLSKQFVKSLTFGAMKG